jgi:hypothetical protein
VKTEDIAVTSWRDISCRVGHPIPILFRGVNCMTMHLRSTARYVSRGYHDPASGNHRTSTSGQRITENYRPLGCCNLAFIRATFSFCRFRCFISAFGRPPSRRVRHIEPSLVFHAACSIEGNQTMWPRQWVKKFSNLHETKVIQPEFD